MLSISHPSARAAQQQVHPFLTQRAAALNECVGPRLRYQEKTCCESLDSARQRSPRGRYSVTSMICPGTALAPRNCARAGPACQAAFLYDMMLFCFS